MGAVLPLLPTTPFLLLAAACFARSSPRLSRWLATNRLFGAYLTAYREGRGLSPRFLLAALAVLWTGLALSAFLCIPPRLWWWRLALAAVGLAVTIHVLRRARRRRS